MPLPVSAAFAWSNLGLQWMEMMAASSHVIAHRTSRNNTPAQLFHMGNEKVLASIEAASAMAPEYSLPCTSAVARTSGPGTPLSRSWT